MLDQWRTDTAKYIQERYGHDQWQDNYSRERLARWVEEQATELVSLEEHGKPVGTITASLNGDINHWSIDQLLEPALYLYRINVVPAYMGIRIGESMIEWAEGKAEASNVDQLRLEVWSSATRLLRYYEGLGFQRFGDAGQGQIINCVKRLC